MGMVQFGLQCQLKRAAAHHVRTEVPASMSTLRPLFVCAGTDTLELLVGKVSQFLTDYVT